MDALIGYTGFVGSNLAESRKFGAYFNSSNFKEMAGRHFDTIVCAATPAVKYLANKNPEEDAAKIEQLSSVLANVTADHFVLISTIDVYPEVAAGHTENHTFPNPHPEAYGRHRYEFEQYIRWLFPSVTVVRLPALFGHGLKKNVIFDLLNDNGLDKISLDSSFQWYPLAWLWSDITATRLNDIDTVNLFPEPILTRDIVTRFFPEKLEALSKNRVVPVRYDTRTKNGYFLGGTPDYAMNADEIFQAMREFISAYKRGR